ncbi:MAG: class II aldolase/adducin family protein [Verrucomicrobiales bacterium]
MESFSLWQHPRTQLVECMARIYSLRMTTTSGGNLSIQDETGHIWITPSRVDKGQLREEDIVKVTPSGASEGLHPASSELPFHGAIYGVRADLKAIIHAHPSALVAFSLCRMLPQAMVSRHTAEWCAKLAIAAYACPGTDELGQNIAHCFRAGAEAVLLENHGVVVGGRDLAEAFQRFETLEYLSQTLTRCASLGGAKICESFPEKQKPAHAETVPSILTTQERAVRSELSRFVQRCLKQRLMISSAGSASSRLSEEAFLITPHGRDRLEMIPSALVKVCSDKQEGEASDSTPWHQAIYEKNPSVGAVIHAQPLHGSAFAFSRRKLETRTIPESFLVLKECPLISQADFTPEKIAELVQQHPALVIENEGVLVVGKSLLEAYDRLEVLEATAEALVLAHGIGPTVPMPESAVIELLEHFPNL